MTKTLLKPRALRRGSRASRKELEVPEQRLRRGTTSKRDSLRI